MDYLQPPSYCPDALATDVGWINPKNGELLISVKNLRQKLAERDRFIKQQEVAREDDRSTTQKILDDLTATTITKPKEDDRTDTQKILDQLSAIENLPAREDNKSETEKILDKVTGVTIRASGGRDLQLNINDESKVVESFGNAPPPAQPEEPKKRGRGRPRKIKSEEKE